MPAHLFGTAANLWAHYAMKIPLEEFEAEVIATTKSEGGLNEDLLEGLATIGSVMQEVKKLLLHPPPSLRVSLCYC